jgi:hypothetical protein
MVHALAESCRVLKAGGRLVDLRPYSSGWPLEVVTPNTQMLAGPLDDTIGQSVDIASDTAVLEALQRGWFQAENKTSFQYTYYWDTVDDMHEYLEANWEESATVPDSVLSKARRLVQRANKPAQIRIRRTMSLASYRKLAEAK